MEEDIQPAAENAPATAADPSPAPAPAQAEYSDAQKAQIRQLIEQRDRQWQQHWAQQQQASQQVSQQAPAPAASPGPDPMDEVEAEIAALYSDDDVGKRTRLTIDKHLNLMLKKLGVNSGDKLTREEVERIADERSNRVREQIRSGITITQEVQDLIQRGVIADDDARTVQKAYSDALRDPAMAQAADNPVNAPWILKGVVYDLVKEGKVRPYSKPKRPTNPLQPGSASPATPQSPPDDPAKSPFQAVRQLDKKRLAAIRDLSQRNYERANTHG